MFITKKSSIKDIALEAGVSVALVSFVLNGKGRKYRIGEETIKHVKEVAERMHYQPNAAAKSLRSGKSKSIGVVLSDISNPFFANIARGVEDTATKMGYTVFFCSSDENSEKLGMLVQSLMNRSVDGLIIVPCEGSDEIMCRLLEHRIPVVLFDRPYKEMEVSSVSLNNFGASYKAVKHLIDSGFKRVAMIAYDVQLDHMQDRIKGYKAAMEDNSMKPLINVGYLKYEDPRKTAAKVITRMLGKKVDALFFATNTISLACLHYINEQGIKIPDELGLIGFDGNDAFDLFYSSLSYVKQPIAALSHKVVEVVVEMIEKDMVTVNNIQIEGELIIRDSSVRR